MNVTQLTRANATAHPLPTPDEPSFNTLLTTQQQREWSRDVTHRQAAMQHHPMHIYTTQQATERALRCGCSDARSLDDLPISLIGAMPHIGMNAYNHYQRRLSTHPEALSNVAL